MTQGSKKLDCYVSVITPENIEFEYALAGPFQRLPAFLFDVGVRALVFFAVMFVGSFTLAFLPLGSAVLTVLSLIGYFVLSWFYGVYFETRFNGRTIGKMVFRLRAVSTDGRPINASQAFLRNLLRLADMCFLLSLQVLSADAPPFYGIPTMVIGFATMSVTSKSQRLGDLAAGTMVISEQRKRSPFNLQPDDKRAFGLAVLIPATYQPPSSLAQTVGLYMENRKRLSPLRRNDVARHLAMPLIHKFGLLPDTSPDLLLCALYVRTFMSADQQSAGRAEMRRLSAGSRPTVVPAVLAANPVPAPPRSTVVESPKRDQASSVDLFESIEPGSGQTASGQGGPESNSSNERPPIAPAILPRDENK